MPVQSCGRAAADSGAAGISNPSADAAAALQKEREALLAELSRLQAEEERVIARLDKIEEAIAAAAADALAAAGAPQTDAVAGVEENVHRPHVSEHAAGGMSAAIKRSIGRAVESFARDDAKGGTSLARRETVATECSEADALQDGSVQQAGAKRGRAAGIEGEGKVGTARAEKPDKVGLVHSEQTADTGRSSEKTAGADSKNPFADLQAALNAFDQTF